MNHSMIRLFSFAVMLMAADLARISQSQLAVAESAVQLTIVDTKLGPPAQYGLQRLTAALKSNGIRLGSATTGAPQKLIIGTYGGSDQIKKWVDGGSKDSSSVPLEKKREALVVKRPKESKPTLVVAGFDDVGLMYALLEIADMVEYSRSE